MRRLDTSALSLPAYGISGELNRMLAERGCAVVTAPPGAGKSTVLPLTILDGLQDGGKVLMLEPRRIAARQIAERMASLLGEPVGRTVGYRIRFESKVSKETRIEVLTEGILTRMLVEDPTMDGVSAVIFDEFHERSLSSDLALALTREAREVIRPDLRLVIMSATIDATSICEALNAPLVTSPGRMFPVSIIHSTEDARPENAAEMVAHWIRTACREHDGDILAFLPGEADIRKCQQLLGTVPGSMHIHPLYGMLSTSEQRQAIAPGIPGERKVVLATPIAETSLTIEGVRIVVDSGLFRRMVFNQQNALSRLETTRITRDMADQRTGRAGRVAEGVCYRLWSQGSEYRMAEVRTPEILEADLASTILNIAAWGEDDPGSLPWLTPPPPAHVIKAVRILEALGALEGGHITPHGRRLASVPCHPRMAQMLIKAETDDMRALAADIAAVLEERDPLAASMDCALSLRIEAMREARKNGRHGKWAQIIRISEQYRSIVRVREDNSSPDPYAIGVLLAAAYPERIAKAHAGGYGHFMLACGDLAAVDRDDGLASHEWVAVASLNSREGGEGRIFLGAPLDPRDVKYLMRERDVISWDSKRGSIVAQHEYRIGGLLVEAGQISDIRREQVVDAICNAARKEGTSMLDFSDEVAALQRRISAVASWRPELGLPDLSTDKVLERATEWLPAYLGKAITTAELKKIDMVGVLWGMLSYEQQTSVERLAPSHIAVPTGSRIRVEYRQGAEAPVLRVRLQECFGMLETPRVDDGRRPVLMELLSPGFKPVQLTKDLRSFWKDTYFEVRKELRRRYPKHSWPDNPLEAEAVRGVRKR